MRNLRIHLLQRIHRHLPVILQLLLRLRRPRRPLPLPAQPGRLAVLRREVDQHRLGAGGGRPAHVVRQVVADVHPAPLEVVLVVGAVVLPLLLDLRREVAHLLPLLHRESVDPTESIALIDGIEFLKDILHETGFVQIVLPADGEVEEGHEAEDHEHGVGAAVGDASHDDVGMVLLDSFDGGYGIGEEVTFGGVVAFHFPSVVDGLDDAGMDGGSGPFLRGFSNGRRQTLHLRRPILRGLSQFRLQYEIFHLLSNCRHTNLLVIDRRRLERILRLAALAVLAILAVYGGTNFLPGFDDIARLDVDVAEVGHGSGECGVGLVEDRGDGIQCVI
mmetsp:Transcript_4698/g.9193  ORF Transcript_4698/g.9193 Transcript_4698/m.9193 type:complete len:332 (-) Transcript_4698:417-1412(-)